MDKYTKVAKIGQGSFGCAYLVTRKNDPLAKKYVIKEIRMDPRDQQSALREAKLLAALDHPNIIACKESFLLAPVPAARIGARAPPPQQQVLCIVTEFADGGDLRKRLERGDRLRESEVLDLFVQVCLALKHLHDRKIIHRDIKPENIFLTRANVVKLGDFGVATVLSNTLACAETMTGTPYYTSPEICLGKRYNSKTDIWSLGCVLYELATLAHAFNGRSQRQLFDNIVNASVAPIPAAAASKRLAELVAEMLRKNPRERPSVNQIIKKPIVMERIQGFLSERALADELNHTVLHGHHIFRKHQPVAMASPLPPPPAPSAVRRAPAAAKSPSTDAAGSAVRRAEAVLADRRKQLAVVAAATPQKKKKLGAAAASDRTPSVVLKKTRSFKKDGAAAAAPSSARGAVAAVRSPLVDRKRLGGASAGASAASSASPSKSTLEQRSRVLLQKKRAIVEKAKQEALRVRLVPAASGAGVAKAQPGAQITQVSDRVSAFNAQWRAQRQQLMQNLPVPPAAARVAGGGTVGLLPPPPPPVPAAAAEANAVGGGAEKRASEYPRPVETAAPLEQVFVPPTAAAAAPTSGANARRRVAPTGAAVVKAATTKLRDAMRKDIQSRKLQLKQAAAGGDDRVKGAVVKGASPLDDPIILVQNLPDYGALSLPPSSANSTGDLDVPLPPPAPVSLAGAAVNSGGSSAQELDNVDAVSEGDDDELADDDDDENDNENDDEDSGEAVEKTPVSLEFERMVLQLKSVVESPDLDDDDNDDDDEEEDSNSQLLSPPFQHGIPEDASGEEDENGNDERGGTAACSPLPPAYNDALVKSSQRPTAFKVSTLEDPAFTTALRALLVGGNDHEQLTAVASEHQSTLRWLHRYITSITSPQL